MLRRFWSLLLFILFSSSQIFLFKGQVQPARAEKPVVHAVLFYSPSCPHCHQVITQDLPPLLEKYQDQLLIIGVDTYTAGGQQLYQAAIQRYNIPEERRGVPALIVGDVVLVGSLEIPEQFPGLIEQYLAAGGVDWPDIPGLAEAMAEVQTEETATAEASAGTQNPAQPTAQPQTEQAPLAQETTAPPATQGGALITPDSSSGLILDDNPPGGLSERLARDPAGNTLSIFVLVGMLLSLAGALLVLTPSTHLQYFGRPSIYIPLLALVGLGIAAYLAYVETAQVSAVCGPIGDCNAVQQSQYAKLFGVLSIGVLGVVGYLAILAAWLVARHGQGKLASRASLALLGMTLFGTLFSIYLTFLEPFVIGATCAWCLTSAVIMTILLCLSVAPGKQPLYQLIGKRNAYTRSRYKRRI
jgi:uncharacterized membrane protein